VKRILFHVWRGTFCDLDMSRDHPWPVFPPIMAIALAATVAFGVYTETWLPTACLMLAILIGCALGYARSSAEEQQP
jgi:hypothetical protein